MLIPHVPRNDGLPSYIHDPSGKLFFCHDWDSVTMHRIASRATGLVVGVAEVPVVPPEVQALIEGFDALVCSNNQTEPARLMTRITRWQELAAARDEILKKTQLRLLGGVDQDQNGDWMLALCFVPEEFCGCELVVKV